MPALPHKPIIHKRTNRFVRFQSDNWKRLSPSWRKPKGIDSRMRRQFRGMRPVVKVGYRSDKATRYMLASGYYPVRVACEKDLEALRMNNSVCCAVFASQLGQAKREILIQKCQEMGIQVVNGKTKQIQEAQ